MKCCCKDYVETALVLGSVLAILSLIGCIGKSPKFIVFGVLGALIHGILIFGAIKRNATAILIWSILGLIYLIGLVAFLISIIVIVSGPMQTMIPIVLLGKHMIIVMIIVLSANILFNIWTHFVAYKARAEIIKAGAPDQVTAWVGHDLGPMA